MVCNSYIPNNPRRTMLVLWGLWLCSMSMPQLAFLWVLTTLKWGPRSSLSGLFLYSTDSTCGILHQSCTCSPSFLQIRRKPDVPCADNGTHMELICPLHKYHLSGFAIVDQNEIDGNHLIVTCTLHDQENMIKSHVLIDYGTTSYAFIDEDHACHYHLLLHLLKSPRNLTIIDRTAVTSRTNTHITHTYLAIRNY
jgi:hypothetical protein